MSKLTKPKSPAVNEKLYNAKPKLTGVHIGISYLDKNKYGLKELLKTARDDRQCLDLFYNFLLEAQEYNDIGTFISAFISHSRANNQDDLSVEKIKQLQNSF